MTHEHLHRPDDSSHQPHWDNSQESSSTDPYTARQSSPYQSNNEGYPSANPSPIYSQSQPEPYWGKNRPPYIPQTSPFSNNNLPGGLPPLTRKELEARHPRTPGKPRREPKDFFGLSIKDDVDKPSSGYQETAHNIVKGDNNSDNADSAISPTSGTDKVKNLSKDIPGLSNEVGKPLDKGIQDKFTQKFKTSADYLQPIEVVHNQKSEAVNEALGSKAVSAGKKIYMGKKGANDPRVLPYEVAHFHPKSIKEGSGLVKCWVKDDPAVKEAERKRREAEAERKRQAAIKAAADKAAADKAAANKRKADALVKQSKEDKTQEKNPYVLTRRPPTDFTGLKEKIAQSSLDQQKQLGQPNQTQQKKEQLQQKTFQAKSDLKNVLKDSNLSPALGAQAFNGAMKFSSMSEKDKGAGTGSEQKKPSGFFNGAMKMGQSSGIAEMGKKILKGGSNLDDIVKTAPKPLLALTSPAMLAASVIPGVANMFGAPANAATVAPKPQEEKKKDDGGWFGKAKAAGTSAMNSVKEVGDSVSKTAGDAWNGASKWVSEPKQEHGGLFGGALKFGKDLCNGAMGLGQKVLKNNPEALVNPGFLATSVLTSPEAKKFTEAIPGWIDKQVDNSLKRRSEIINASLKPLEHIPVVGKAAQAFAWFENKVGEFGGGALKGAGSLVGGVANMVTYPVETASGIYAMAEHVPLMGGLVPNPLKLAHAGVDVMFNGADPKTRMETVFDPDKSLKDDAKFGKALVKGFVEPYKKSWSEGKYFEVAGRATFDIGSMFVGAGEANAAIKTGEVASVAAKTAEVANVASKTSEVANVASKSGKAAGVASTAGKVDKASDVANIADKFADTGKGAKTTTEAIEGSNKTANGTKVSKNVDFSEGNWDGKRRTGVGNLEGRRLSRRELNSLEHELNENGLNLNRKADKVIRQQGGTDKARAAFDYESGTVLLRNGATYFEAFHEMTHARQFIEIGQKAYISLGRFEREAHVFNTIWKNRRLFTKSEIEASIEYIRYLRAMKRLGRID